MSSFSGIIIWLSYWPMAILLSRMILRGKEPCPLQKLDRIVLAGLIHIIFMIHLSIVSFIVSRF